jgi:hypothetical protein
LNNFRKSIPASTIWWNGSLVRDCENFKFLHFKTHRTRNKRSPVQSDVVDVTRAKAVFRNVSVCFAIIGNTNVTQAWTAFGTRIDCLVLLLGHQRKSRRREVVRIVQRENETHQTRVVPMVIVLLLRLNPRSLEPSLTWTSLAFEFLEAAWIEAAVLCPAGQKIGVVLNDDNDTIGGIWDLDDDHRLRQTNVICDGIGKFITAKWTGQLRLGGESATSFFVIGTTGMVELSGRGTFFWPQPPSSLFLFGDIGAARFYINGRAELRVMNIAEPDHPREIPPQPARQFSVVRVRAQGTKAIASVMHLYRCASCRLPLLCPLVSKTQDGALQQCYCSRKCQKDHWITGRSLR